MKTHDENPLASKLHLRNTNSQSSVFPGSAGRNAALQAIKEQKAK